VKKKSMHNSKQTIRPYQGRTFVAFLDISGFKKMMERGEAEAGLIKFYSRIFEVGKQLRVSVNRNFIEVDTIAVSDCAVIFPRIKDSSNSSERIKGLRSILEFIRRVNSLLILPKDGPQILTTCSIDYGKFKYENRTEVSDAQEAFFVGKPYVNAFLDNEFGKPRLLQGQCRVLKDNLGPMASIPWDDPFSLLVSEGRKYYYFYWMVRNREAIKRFKKAYSNIHEDVYKELKNLICRECFGTL